MELDGGDTAVDGAELGFVFLVGHLEDLNAQNDTLDHVDNLNNTEGNESEDDSQDAGLDVLLNEAGNTDGIESDAHDTKRNFIHSFHHLYVKYNHQRLRGRFCRYPHL